MNNEVDYKYHAEAMADAIRPMRGFGDIPTYTGALQALREYEKAIKPRVIIVNGIEVPEPLKHAPPEGTLVWYVNLGVSGQNFGIRVPYTARIHQHFIKRGLFHLTEEAAVAHAKAMLAWKKPEDEAKPDADGWIEWNGGENPVPGSEVRYRMKKGEPMYAGPVLSDHLRWLHIGSIGDIVKYKVV